MELASKSNPADVEGKWYQYWLDTHCLLYTSLSLIIRVASTDHNSVATDDVAVTEVVDTEVISDEMIDVALDRAMPVSYTHLDGGHLLSYPVRVTALVFVQ